MHHQIRACRQGLIDPALRIPEPAGERVIRHHRQPHLVRDHHHRRRARIKRGHQRRLRLVEIVVRQQVIAEPHCDTVKQHYLFRPRLFQRRG